MNVKYKLNINIFERGMMKHWFCGFMFSILKADGTIFSERELSGSFLSTARSGIVENL